MGLLNALAIQDEELGLDLSAQLGFHLGSNCYPPSQWALQPCIDAVQAYWEDDLDKEIELPKGASFRGSNTAPARAIIINFHLDAWCEEED